MNLPFTRLLRRIGREADALGVPAYAVGGVVRDALLGRITTDLDVVVVGPGSGIALAEAVARTLGLRRPAVYARFGTAALTVPPEALARLGEPAAGPLVVEFVGARRESYRAESRKPVVEDGSLADDLARRDFTVNALAVALGKAGGEAAGTLVDAFGGQNDLAARRLRTPLDPAVTFADDPLRMLRAARFAAQLGFQVVPEAVQAMRAAADRVAIVSQERLTDELDKLLGAPAPSAGLRLLHETGLLEHLLPEIARLEGVEAVGAQRHKDNFFHTLDVLDNLVHLQRGSDDPDVNEDGRARGRARWLRWAALFHDVAKPDTKRFEPGTGWTFHGHDDLGARRHVPRAFERLRLPQGEMLAYVQAIVRLHHRPSALVDGDVTDAAVRRLLFDAGDLTDDLMRFVRADVTSKNPRRARRYLAGFDRVEARMREVEAGDELRNWQPPIDGHEIMDVLGVGEGLAVGLAKTWIREAILDGEIPGTHEAARALLEARKPDALRRAALFQQAVRTLPRTARRGTGALKEALTHDALPEDDAAALAYLHGVAEEAVSDGPAAGDGRPPGEERG
ncbi:MAG: CCA tRNA nucleotidyltransferase [Rubricoccaceae bacterium]